MPPQVFVARIRKFAHITPFTQLKVAFLAFDCDRGMGQHISRASVFPCLTTLPGPGFVLLNVATCSFLERGRIQTL